MIKTLEYKTYKFDICFASQGGWGDWKDKFYVENGIFKPEPQYKIQDLEKLIKEQVDEFLSKVPQNDEEWVDKFEEAMIWTDYEVCHLDPKMVIDILKMAKEYYK